MVDLRLRKVSSERYRLRQRTPVREKRSRGRSGRTDEETLLDLELGSRTDEIDVLGIKLRSASLSSPRYRRRTSVETKRETGDGSRQISTSSKAISLIFFRMNTQLRLLIDALRWVAYSTTPSSRRYTSKQKRKEKTKEGGHLLFTGRDDHPFVRVLLNDHPHLSQLASHDYIDPDIKLWIRIIPYVSKTES